MNTEALTKNVEIIVPEDGLQDKFTEILQSNRKLNIKLGIDPTSTDLHLGHLVVLKKMAEFQKLDHNIHLIIGDFTACIGDPSGKNKSRPPLTSREVRANAKTYIQQVEKFIDINKTIISYNSKWLNNLSPQRFLKLISNITLAQIVQRTDFKNRLAEESPIGLHEIIYPIMQGYDSIMIDADVEIGGTDQLFNCMIGKTLQKAHKKAEQVVLCMPILRGTDGQKKMSKTSQNYIGITEEPEDIYGKVMSLPDDLIPEYINLLSDFSPKYKQILLEQYNSNTINPMEIKKELALDITQQCWNQEKAQYAAQFFIDQVQSKSLKTKHSQEILINSLSKTPLSLLELCHKIKPDNSKSDLRRLILSGGVSLDDQKLKDIHYSMNLSKDSLLKIGKRNYYNLKVNR